MTVKMADRGIKGMVPGFRDDLKVVVGGRLFTGTAIRTDCVIES